MRKGLINNMSFLGNKCRYLRIRAKKGIKYQMCIKRGLKGQLNDNLCYMCDFKEIKKPKPMKKITQKQKKLEQNRYSILTNNLDYCFVKGCRNKADDVHEVYAGAKRKISMKNGFCIPLCRKHHSEIQNDESKMLIYKKMCQEKYEENHSREEFIKLIRRNYL